MPVGADERFFFAMRVSGFAGARNPRGELTQLSPNISAQMARRPFAPKLLLEITYPWPGYFVHRAPKLFIALLCVLPLS